MERNLATNIEVNVWRMVSCERLKAAKRGFAVEPDAVAKAGAVGDDQRVSLPSGELTRWSATDARDASRAVAVSRTG